MTLISPASQDRDFASGKAIKPLSYRSGQEIAIRETLEAFCRSRWPGGRIVHELVMDRGTVRADMAVVTNDRIIAFEIKSEYDNMSRLLHQLGMFRLAVTDLWYVCAGAFHADCGREMRYLLPSLGHINISIGDDKNVSLHIVEEAEPYKPYPQALLSMLWVSELYAEAIRYRVVQSSKPSSHAKLVSAMLKLTPEEQINGVCRQLRARQAFWRADPPIIEKQQIEKK